MRFRAIKMAKNIVFGSVLVFLLWEVGFFNAVTPPFIVVNGTSMLGTFNRGDIVFWRPAKVEDVHVGDIIIFKSQLKKAYVIHRVYSIKKVNGEIEIYTKGDHNNYVDQDRGEAPVTKRNLVGVVIYNYDRKPLKIPYLGYIVLSFYSFNDYLSEKVWGKKTHMSEGVVYLLWASVILSAGIILSREDYREFLYLGNKKISVKKLFIAIFLILLVISTIPVPYLSSTLTYSYGINERINAHTDLYFGNLTEGKRSHDYYYIHNPCLMPVRVVVWKEGEGNLRYNATYILDGGTMKMENVEITGDGEGTGVHGGKIHIYSSAYWAILPDFLVVYSLSLSPRYSFIILNVFSSFLYTLFILSLMIFSDILSEVVEGIKYERRPRKREYGVIIWFIAELRGLVKSLVIFLRSYFGSTENREINIHNLRYALLFATFFSISFLTIPFGFIPFVLTYCAMIVLSINFVRRRDALIFATFIYAASYPVYALLSLWGDTNMVEKGYVILFIYDLALFTTLFILPLLSLLMGKISSKFGINLYDY